MIVMEQQSRQGRKPPPGEGSSSRYARLSRQEPAKAGTPNASERQFAGFDRGRESGIAAPPPSEPDVQISRIRLSGQWVLKRKTVTVNSWAFSKLNSPCVANQRLVHC